MWWNKALFLANRRAVGLLRQKQRTLSLRKTKVTQEARDQRYCSVVIATEVFVMLTSGSCSASWRVPDLLARCGRVRHAGDRLHGKAMNKDKHSRFSAREGKLGKGQEFHPQDDDLPIRG
jgi:hypothetical protein